MSINHMSRYMVLTYGFKYRHLMYLRRQKSKLVKLEKVKAKFPKDEPGNGSSEAYYMNIYFKEIYSH